MPGIVLISLAAAVAAALAGTAQWRRRRTSALALPIALAMFGAAEWSATQVVFFLADDERVKTLFIYALYPGVALTVAAGAWYAALLTGNAHLLTRRVVIAGMVEPVLLVLAVVTNPWHHGMFTRIGFAEPGTFVVQYGPIFWAHAAYSFAVLLAGMGLVARAMVQSVAGHRRLYGVALASMALPSLANVVSITRPGTGAALDLTPALFLVTGSLWVWIERHRTELQAVPISTKQVLAALSDAVLVVDDHGRVVDANPAATALLDRWRPDLAASLVGTLWGDLVGPELAQALTTGGQHTVTTATGAVLDVRVTPLPAPMGTTVGSVVVARDVSELERLRAELAELAVRDGLTGLHNRRHLEQAVVEAVEQAETSGRPLSAVMIDVDHFKAVNDRYGHAVGDQVLVTVARRIADGLGAEVVARYGGEEFVALLPGLTVPQALALVDGWRAVWSGEPVRTAAGPLPVTLSAGVAGHRRRDPAARVLDRADEALYAAKAAGRDRVVAASEEARV